MPTQETQVENKTMIQKAANKLESVRLALMVAIGSLFMTSAATAATPIGVPTTGPFQELAAFFQLYVDFMEGPYATAAVLVSVIVAAFAWSFAPKEGFFGMALRTVVAGIVAMNAATWLASFT